LLTTFVIAILIKVKLENSLLNIHNAYADNIVNVLKLNVTNQYKSILFHKVSTLDIRKTELKDMSELTIMIIKKRYEDYIQGRLTEQEAKKSAIDDISNLRYSNGVGYFWINDTLKPYPKMINHPIIPDLNGKVLDDTAFNCTFGKNKNLFQAFVDVCLKDGSGYVEYLWPKPTKSGITVKQPKISYITLFKPWGWIIGTGLYIDDLQKDVDKRIQAVIDELNLSMNKLNISKDSYGYIFNSKGKLLVHPYLRDDTTTLRIINKLTGNTFFHDFTASHKDSIYYVDYLWTKPNDTTKFIKKRTYITYFKPLDWYIASSFYLDDIYTPIKKITKHIILSISILLFIILIISLIFTRSVTRPISLLSEQVDKINKTDKLREIKLIKSNSELSQFTELLNKMILSILHTQKELKTAKQKAEESNKLKSAFLANMSHEIRTPMNGIIGFAELITSKTITEQERLRYSKIIRSSSFQLLNIVNDIIDISKIESGYVTFNPTQVSVKDLFKELQVIYSDRINNGNLKFIVETDDTNDTIITDGTKLRQVIENLISNAIKFTETGFIKLEYKFTDKDVMFSVEDTGIGISKDMQEIIFDRFMQADNINEIKMYRGTGLGLAISKAYVTLMKGLIWVKSTPNIGSKFYLMIPIDVNKSEKQ
jgi:signal transduction histidine kinase